MPYGSEQYEVKGIGGYEAVPCEPQKPTVKDHLDETCAILKELLACMNDSRLAMFGDEMPKPNEPLPEPCNLYATSALVLRQAHFALDAFLAIRKKLF